MKLTYNDKQHAYWLDGKRCKGVTSVAKYPDDTYAIDRWRDRMVVIGMAVSPPLVHRAAAHFDERDRIQDIAEEAKVIAKAHEAADRGTANHRIAERVDLGLTVIDTPESEAVAAAWTAALEHAGIDIVPELVERIIVHPDQLVAGRFDRIGRYRVSGRHVGVDIKTGKNAIQYPHSTVTQLGLYFNAPLMAGPLNPGKDGTDWTTTFEPLPDDLHRDHAIVIYLPPDGPARCFRVDIAAGWKAATTICFPTIAWRKTNNLIDEITELKVVADPQPIDPDAFAYLSDRVDRIKAAGHAGALAVEWSKHPEIPTFPKGGPRTVAEFELVDDMCDRVEAAAGMDFGPSDPTAPTATKATLTKRD